MRVFSFCRLGPKPLGRTCARGPSEETILEDGRMELEGGEKKDLFFLSLPPFLVQFIRLEWSDSSIRVAKWKFPGAFDQNIAFTRH